MSRRSVLTGSAAAVGALGLGGAVALPRTAGAAELPADVSRAIVDSTMTRFTPATFGGWSYHKALYLYGQYLVYKRTGERRYLDFIRAWVDRFVTDAGIANSFNSLDAMRPAQLLPLLYAETGLWKYRTAAEQVRRRIGTYPRTTDGALIHNVNMRGELWCDGVYMALPFLAAYGRTFGDAEYCYDQAGKNMAVYFQHLKSANGLMFHAYDQDGSAPWAKGNGGRSTVHWGRAIGWFGMTAVDLLDILPAGHPRRAGLIEIVRHLAAGYRRYQGAHTGMWYQVVNRSTDARNWRETSCSAMFTFMLSRGVQRGWLGEEYRAVATKGYNGVLKQLSVGADGLTRIADICEGTNIGDEDYYFGRLRRVNDTHGIGAFLIMNEQLRGQ
ncbi:glycoside hydrolase family 88/105 protein [Spirilliplanes yamanashiensis]|nr:glycoside hydrolase family 88 protein [Spirilliplanes yamanashiensis]MDP9815245.1 unsaturated rhamnogalacturonyl hydrolase [Spirilliplanes yamanashiensis]